MRELQAADAYFARLAAKFAPDSAVIDDYHQEARIAAWQAMPHHDPGRGASMRTFMLAAAGNRLRDIERIRIAKRRGSGVRDVRLEIEIDTPLDEAAIVASIDMEAHLAILDETEREVMRLTVIEDRSDPEAGAILHLTRDAIRTCRMVALKKLREKTEEK